MKILSKVDSLGSALSSIADMYSGVKAYEAGKGNPLQTEIIRDTKPFTSSKKTGKSWLPFYDGKHIGRYQDFWKGNNWINYGPWLAAPREPENFSGEKILIRKIVGVTLIANYSPETSYCNTLLFVLKLKPISTFPYYSLLGILNSSFIGWYYRKKFQISADDTFPQIMIRDILQFPLPVFSKAANLKLNVSVANMLDLHQKLPLAKTDHEKTIIQRQIDSADRRIDELVYELYGLTEEEIKIVEATNEGK